MKSHLPIASQNVTDLGGGRGIPRSGTPWFAPENALKIVLTSGIVVTPCFWHPWLVAGDFGSHLYNTWLAQLIERGQAPGLWLAPQWYNVLFDLLLKWLAEALSIPISGKLAAAIASLLFFWGAFAFVNAAAQRPPWAIIPLLLMVTYGWTFQKGLLNYYLSVGLAFAGLAFFWGGNGRLRLLLLVISPAILLAHPIGFVWFLGGALYLCCSELVPQRFHFLIVLACLGSLCALHWLLWRNYQVAAPARSVFFYNGLDQMIFTSWYLIPTFALALFVFFAMGRDLTLRGSETHALQGYLIPLELYVIVEASVVLLPESITWSPFAAPSSRLTERFTLISAVLLCCLLGAAKQRRWFFPPLMAISAVFFILLYRDTSALNRMQEQTWRLVHTAKPGERILVRILSPAKYRFATNHLVDQACVGYCFSYGNYEAPSKQFRIRAAPGNHYVMGGFEQVSAMEDGVYIVQPDDLPASEIYQCGPSWRDLCIRPLQAGERNDRLGIHPELSISPIPKKSAGAESAPH